MISQNAIDFDSQPDGTEEQPENTGGSSRLVLWLVMFSLGILFLPLYLISTTIQESVIPLESELATLEAQLTATPAPDPAEEALRAELLSLNQQVRALEVVQGELETNHTNWPAIMAVIAGYDQNVMRLTALKQTDIHVTLNGAAQNESVVTAYADDLRASAYFDSVKVQSLNLRILPTATPPKGNASDGATAAQTNSTGLEREVEFTILMTLGTSSNVESE
ncbi:MAG: hypothetical protein CL610_13060 [Anaerolineaceae bacterium]|nr:hypothetical protein [Anaerolineaceae bacterium]